MKLLQHRESSFLRLVVKSLRELLVGPWILSRVETAEGSVTADYLCCSGPMSRLVIQSRQCQVVLDDNRQGFKLEYSNSPFLSWGHGVQFMAIEMIVPCH
jgi:hypothetical protein